jgi:hypothetical protein
MQIVGALDVHRRQITYKTLDLASGDVRRGRLSPANRQAVREWLERFGGREAEFALEGTTGWRFVAEEIERAGHVAHLADPAETATKRGSKRRAKTDRTDCDLQLKLLLAGELPESWIPPAHILELRTRVRTRKTLVDQRSAWQLRLTAQLFHQGVPAGINARTRAGREALARGRARPPRRAHRELRTGAAGTRDSLSDTLTRVVAAPETRPPAGRAHVSGAENVAPPFPALLSRASGPMAVDQRRGCAHGALELVKSLPRPFAAGPTGDACCRGVRRAG